MKSETLSVRPEAATKQRYAAAAKAPEAALCCPVEYDKDLLKIIPQQLYGKEPYRQHFAFIEPVKDVPPLEAEPYACGAMRVRHPKETKGHDYHATTEPSQCRDGGNGGCC